MTLASHECGAATSNRESLLDGRVHLIAGDCLERLADIEAASIDAIVTDPPYGLEFMGKGWDGADGFRRSLNAADAGRENVFGRTSKKAPEYRTSGAGVKNAPGIGARETEWVSNQGWNQYRCSACGKLIGQGGSPCVCDEPAPVRADNRWPLFQEFMHAVASECLRVLKPGGHMVAFGGTRTYHRVAVAIEDAGFEIRDSLQWMYGSGFPKSRNLGTGWGTALKPAYEPIVLARKPLIGTVAANVEKHGTGAINIDGCRVHADDAQGGEYTVTRLKPGATLNKTSGNWRPEDGGVKYHGEMKPGRWPANVLHDGSAEVMEAFPDAPGQQQDIAIDAPSARTGNVYGKMNRHGEKSADERYTSKGSTDFAALPGMRRNDSGSAARFFYSAKADASDRIGSKHPTVKPVDLMQWLCRLVTPPGGTVLDPFAGTGTTGEAAFREGFNAVLIEREIEYQGDIRRRMALAMSGPDERKRESIKARLGDVPFEKGSLFGELEGTALSSKDGVSR